MKVLVVDADPMFRYGMGRLLQQQVDCEVVGEAQQGQEALEKAQTLRPDVVLMDVSLPGMDGLETARQLRAVLPQVKIVLCTSAEQDDECLQAIRAGAHGYLPKQIEPAGLSRALRGVCHDEVALSRATTTTLFEACAGLLQTAAEARCSCEVLSLREEEVLWLLATGMGNKAIASRLCISENTVKSHMKHILRKLGLTKRVEAAAYALRFRHCVHHARP